MWVAAPALIDGDCFRSLVLSSETLKDPLINRSRCRSSLAKRGPNGRDGRIQLKLRTHAYQIGGLFGDRPLFGIALRLGRAEAKENVK